MTTQELKQYIDKVLGNSIRCLLPSYWWKRLFSLTLEKVDEKLDATNIKTINGESIVGEGNLKVGVTTVGSIDELNALEASVGDIATVGEESAMLVRAGDLPQVNVPSEILGKWDNLTRIVKVEFGEPVTENGRQAIVYLNGKKPYNYDTIHISSSEGGFFCAHIVAGEIKEITIEEVNERLKKHDYRFMMGSNGDGIDRAFKLHAYSASADAYIKSDSWEKLSKEYIVSSEEELNALSVENGTIAKVAKWQYGEVDPYQCYSIRNESSHDDDTIKRIWDKLTRISHIDITYPETPPTVMPASPTILLHGYASSSDDVIQITYYQESYKIEVGNSGSVNIVSIDEINTILQEKDYRLIDLTSDKYARPFIEEHITFYSPNANITANAYIKGETWTRLLKEGDVTGGGADITIDSELSDTSKNPVQNKAVKAYVDEKVANVGGTTIREFYIGDSLTDEQKAWNLETAMMVEEKKCTTIFKITAPIDVLPAGTTIPLSAFVDRTFLYVCSIGVNAAYVSITIDSNGNSDITVEPVSADAAMSSTSTNAVQNKAVTNAINAKADKTYVDEKTYNNSYAIVLASNGFHMNRYGKDGSSLGKVYIKPNVPTRVYATTFAPNGSTGRIKSIKLSHLDTQGATDMGFMFGSSDVWQNVEELDLSYLDTSSVTVMDNFAQLPKVTKLDVTSFDTSNVVNMSCMFRFCENLTDIDVSNFDTSKVLYFDSMFGQCKSLKSLDLSNFNTSSATTMSQMFFNCRDLEYLNLSSFDTSNIENLRGINGIFFGCGSIKTLILGENFFRVAAPIEGDGLQYMNSADFSGLIQWTDESVVTSLVTNSYDRIANGLPEINLSLSSQTMAILTDEHKAIIAAKGYTLQ